MIPREGAAQAAHLALDGIQRLRPHEMVAGVSLLFAAVCRRSNLSAADMHTLGLKLLEPQAFHHKTDASLQSLQDFAGLRIAGDESTTIS